MLSQQEELVMHTPLLSMTNISKSFSGVKALQNVELSVQPGEVLGLVGENGAGKSTLVKIITGFYQKDGGNIYINGKQVQIQSPIDAQQYGISAVYQDIMLAPKLSVGENLFLGNLPTNSVGAIEWKKVHEEAKSCLHSLNIDLDTKTRLSVLPPGKQEMVSIAKAYRNKSKIIIFDEPTALLTNSEIEELFKMIALLRKEGLGIIYISHRLEEIFTVCDTYLVLKDGLCVNSGKIKDIDESRLVCMMVGRELCDIYSIDSTEPGDKILEVKNLSKLNKFHPINFALRRGEILGMFGLVGSGRTDIVRCIFGAEQPTSGEIVIKGMLCHINTPRDAIKAGIGLLPEDRRSQALALKLSVRNNINLANYRRISVFGIINSKKEREIAEQYCKMIDIKTPSIEQQVRNLSGGNQQKVVISRWAALNPDILIFDEPTVGVDVGARVEIYKLLEKFVNEGKAIILISSYLPEVIGLSDRILVIAEGKQMGIVEKSQFSEENLLSLASGINYY
jgi:ribose transport system ATP-binding protein